MKKRIFAIDPGRSAARNSFSFSLLLLWISLIAGAEPPATVIATFLDGNIQFDGYLRESEWQQAAPINDFRQREPREGEPASEPTLVRVLFTPDYLIIGIQLRDSAPNAIIAKEMELDGRLSWDDNFTVVLDTYHDQRTAFLFRINPNGAKLDAQLADDGESFNKNWNGIWDAKAHITPEGWEAEIIIPFKTLRFNGSDRIVWGVNFRRYIARKNEEVLWQSWRRNLGIRKISAAGTLVIPRRVKRGKHLELKPYITGGIQQSRIEGGYSLDTQSKIGLDLKYGLSPTLTADLTFNTDFAQVEADRARINLTRFNLFYPEKRDFFLESSSNFIFGSMYRSLAFYSRRIGLGPRGEPIPIIVGARLSGKINHTNLGFLNVQTDRRGNTPPTNFTVLRLKQDVFKQSYLGMIFTNKMPADRGNANRVVGMDFTYSTSSFLGNRNLIFHSEYMESFSPDREPQNANWRIYLDYPNDLFDNFVQYAETGKNFNPEMGFVRRKDIRGTYGHIRFAPRPPISNLRKLVFMIRASYSTDFNNVLQSRNLSLRPLGFVLQSGDVMRLDLKSDYERLDYDFNIINNIVIPRGIYRMKRWELQFNSNSSRPVSGTLTVGGGEFYSGTSSQLKLQGRLRFNKYLALSGDFQRTSARLSEGSFTAYETSARLNINFTTHLTSRIFLQWNNEDNEVNLNFRLRWIPKLGSDVYLVYNELQDTQIPGFQSKDRVVMLKVAYWWGI